MSADGVPGTPEAPILPPPANGVYYLAAQVLEISRIAYEAGKRDASGVNTPDGEQR